MADTTTITVRVTSEIRDKLDRLATLTRRSRSFLAAEAIDGFVARELSIVEGIERGRTDIAAGRTVPHKDAMATLRKRVRTTAARTRSKSA